MVLEQSGIAVWLTQTTPASNTWLEVVGVPTNDGLSVQGYNTKPPFKKRFGVVSVPRSFIEAVLPDSGLLCISKIVR